MRLLSPCKKMSIQLMFCILFFHFFLSYTKASLKREAFVFLMQHFSFSRSYNLQLKEKVDVRALPSIKCTIDEFNCSSISRNKDFSIVWKIDKIKGSGQKYAER